MNQSWQIFPLVPNLFWLMIQCWRKISWLFMGWKIHQKMKPKQKLQIIEVFLTLETMTIIHSTFMVSIWHSYQSRNFTGELQNSFYILLNLYWWRWEGGRKTSSVSPLFIQFESFYVLETLWRQKLRIRVPRHKVLSYTWHLENVSS